MTRAKLISLNLLTQMSSLTRISLPTRPSNYALCNVLSVINIIVYKSLNSLDLMNTLS